VIPSLRSLLWLGGLMAWDAAVCAQTAPANPSADPDAALLAQLALPSLWSASAALHSGFGYNDNVLLSHTGGAGRTFARGGVETFAMKMWGNANFFGALNAERTQYFSRPTIDSSEATATSSSESKDAPGDHEAQVLAQLGVWYRTDHFKLMLEAQGFYFDQIFDTSTTDIKRNVGELQLKGGTLGPSLRWTIVPWFWLEGQADARREKFRDQSNDARITEAAVRAGWQPNDRLEFIVEATERRRRYDFRQQYQATELGRAIDNTHLAIREREGLARLNITWGAGRHWNTETRVSAVRYRDNGPGVFSDDGPGFFSHHQRGVVQEIGWEVGYWMIRAEGSAKRTDFDVQEVANGRGQSYPRVKDEFQATMRVERKLSSRWTIYGEYTWERSRSNDVIASYQVNEGLLGARWSWEK
jgi:hypothetical protein